MTKPAFSSKRQFKRVHFLMLFFIVTALAAQISCNIIAADQRKGDKSIIDVRNSKTPEENLSSHKNFDVEVFRRVFILGDEYHVRYYQNENGQLKSHMGSIGAEEDYDRVAYHWLSDTSVSITLYHTVSKEKTFRVFGFAEMNGMDVD